MGNVMQGAMGAWLMTLWVMPENQYRKIAPARDSFPQYFAERSRSRTPWPSSPATVWITLRVRGLGRNLVLVRVLQRDRTNRLDTAICITGRFFTNWALREAHMEREIYYKKLPHVIMEAKKPPRSAVIKLKTQETLCEIHPVHSLPEFYR